jgi:hypothetical protein
LSTEEKEDVDEIFVVADENDVNTQLAPSGEIS